MVMVRAFPSRYPILAESRHYSILNRFNSMFSRARPRPNSLLMIGYPLQPVSPASPLLHPSNLKIS